MINKQSILIVDDDRINIDILVLLLKDEYKLGIAKNGSKALEYAQKHKPDLILLDIIMPDMNGFEVCAKLKEDAATKDIPIIFLTGMSHQEDKQRGLEAGAVDFIYKPIEAEDVMKRILKYLTQSPE